MTTVQLQTAIGILVPNTRRNENDDALFRAGTSSTSAGATLWSSSSGDYAGISLDGSVIRAQQDDNHAYYGRPVTTRDILFGHAGVTPHATALRRALGTV
jgi:lipid-binding SYLF domain-containing protein